MSFKLHPDLTRDGIHMGDFSLCRVLLINDSHYPWFVLVPQIDGLKDTTDLNPDDYAQMWNESRKFGIGIMDVFEGEKLNVAALGNMTPQLHIHHIVRYANDPAWPSPIWGKHPLKPYVEMDVDLIRTKLATLSLLGFTPK